MIDLEITGAERGHLDDVGRDPAEENRTPPSRRSGALSSGRCAGGPPNSQSRLYAVSPAITVSH